jgi:hypothetical protein
MVDLGLGLEHDLSLAELLRTFLLVGSSTGEVRNRRHIADVDQSSLRAGTAEDQGELEFRGVEEVCGNVFMAL